MNIKNILPESSTSSPEISEAYRLKESELAKIIADISAEESLSVRLRSRGILISGNTTKERVFSSHEPVGMLTYETNQRREQKELYLVTFVVVNSQEVNLVDLLREYIR